MEIKGNLAGNNGNTTQTRWTNWTGAFHEGTLNGTTTGWVGPQNSNTDPGFAIGFTASRNWTGNTSDNGNHSHTVTINNTGSSKPFSIMNPYIAVNIWRRIA